MSPVRPSQHPIEVLTVQPVENSRRPLTPAIILLGLGVVLFAVGAKLALIHRYGTDQPYLDQWAAEGWALVRGPLYYHLDWSQYLSLHGEHRPGLSRLWLRGQLLANQGQWDCFVELVANLLVYAAFLGVAWRWISRLVDGAWLGLVAVLMAVLFALPGNYENFLWGFQSCFLFMLLTGLLHVSLTLESTRPAGRWWLAQLAGVLGLFSISAGCMSAAALVILAGLELLRGRRNAWVWSTLAANAVLLGIGLWLLPEAVAPTGSRIAQLGQVGIRTTYLLSWPFAGSWQSLFLQIPWVILLLSSLRRGYDEQSTDDKRVGATGLWVACIASAIAYGRGITPETIGVRYFDVLTVGLFISSLAIIRIGQRLTRWPRVFWRVGALVWLLWLGSGLWRQNDPGALGPLFKFQHDLALEQRQVTKEFLVSSDPAKLQELEDRSHRFPHFQYTVDFLRDPKVPPFLPPSLTPDGHAGPLSHLAVRIAAGWTGVLGLGALLLVVGVLWQRMGAARSPSG